MEILVENVKIAIALRTARNALGWSQQEFADKMKVSKSTIARIETLELTAKAEFLMRALRIYAEAGVAVDLLQSDKIVLTIEIPGINEAKLRLEDETLRRKDKKPLWDR